MTVNCISFRTMVATILIALAATANGSSIVFNNIPASPSYYFNYGVWTGNFLPNTYAISAMNFTPSASGPLDELTLGLFKASSGGTTSTTLRLSPEVGNMPSAPIWQGNLTATSTFGQLSNLTSIGGPTLTAGQTYWLEAFPPQDGVTLDFWDVNNQGDVGSTIGAGNFVPNTNRFALRVGITQVPEPTSLALAVLGLVATGLFTKTMRREVRGCCPATARTTHKRSTQSPAQSGSQCTIPPACCGPAVTGPKSSRPCAR
jgi:hypothetical protein